MTNAGKVENQTKDDLVLYQKHTHIFFWVVSYRFPPVWFKNVLVKISWLSTRKPVGSGNQPTMIGFGTQIFSTLFAFIFVVSYQYDSKMLRSIFHDFWHENSSNLETNPQWLGFDPKNFVHYFLGRLAIAWCKRGLRKLQVKISRLFQIQKSPKLAKWKTKPRLLCLHLKHTHLHFGPFLIILH